MQSFGKRLYQSGNADLIDHFGFLAAANLSHALNGTGIWCGNGPNVAEITDLAADHQTQVTIDGTLLTAGYRRIAEAQSCVFGG